MLRTVSKRQDLTLAALDQSIDVSAAIRRKLQINDRKYPVEKFKGTSRKYNE